MQQYVPMVEMMKEVYVPSLKRTAKVPTALAHQILFAGDQKTAARGRGVSGLIPVVADWHMKVILLEERNLLCSMCNYMQCTLLNVHPCSGDIVSQLNCYFLPC